MNPRATRDPEVLRTKSILGGLVRSHRYPEDHPKVIEARQQLAAAQANAYGEELINKLVPLWPHLADTQRRRLTALIGDTQK